MVLPASQLYKGMLKGGCRDAIGKSYGSYITKDGVFTDASLAFDACAAFCQPMIGPGYVGFVAKVKNDSYSDLGRCSCLFDGGHLPDELLVPDGAWIGSGADGAGPAATGSGLAVYECHPYKVSFGLRLFV